jgi:DNA polymerase-1
MMTVSHTGEIVNAVNGFASMLLKVLNEVKPTHYAVAFDMATPTFRHQQFKEYKEQRPKTPDELKSQFGRVRQMVGAFHMPTFEMEGYEADDVLGTLSHQAAAQGMETIIVTGDIDALQLVSPQVKVLAPQRTFSETVLYDEATVRQKYGLEPAQLIDLKALVGDPSDNIPGVPGIGEKTASRLLAQYGSVEKVFAHIGELSPARIQELLRDREALVKQNKQLVTIVTDMPLSLDLDTCRVSGYDRSRAAELLRELQFVRLLPRLPQSFAKEEPPTLAAPAPSSALSPESAIIGTPSQLDRLTNRLAETKVLAVDLEATSRDAMSAEIVGIALSLAPAEAYYLPVGHAGEGEQLPLPHVLDQLRPLLEDPTVSKIAHNGKYDMLLLERYGVKLQNLGFDTMVAAHLLGERALGLKPLAFTRLGLEMRPITDLIGTGSKQISMAQVEIREAAEYAGADATVCYRLKDLLEQELRREELWPLFSEVEMPLVPVLVHMEKSGVALDTGLFSRLSGELGKQLLKLETDIYNSVGHQFNVNSPQQLSAVLYQELGLPRPRRTKGGYSTEAAVLESLKGSHPVIGLILEYRQLAKPKSTYIDAFPMLVNSHTGRLHTSFNQTGTATGRLSSSEPNLQNIPVRGDLGHKVRQAFVAGEGAYLVGGDYSQIDLRVLAHLSRDPELAAAFQRGEDIHAATASLVFGVAPGEVTPDMRRVAKTINFGVVYGMSDYGLERAADLSREEAAQFIRSYFEKYPAVKAYLEATKEQARRGGFVQTMLGRRRRIPEIDSPNRQLREAAERMAINMPVQGTSADIIKVAMINIYREMGRRGLKSQMTLQVHDELLFEAPAHEVEELKGMVAELMSQAVPLSVLLKVELKIGRTWGEMA